MAGLVWDDGDKARITFYVDDRRRTIRLGKVSKAVARKWRERIGEIVAGLASGAGIAPDAAAWIDTLSDEGRDKLVNTGLLEASVVEAAPVRTIRELCDTFKARASVKRGTAAAYGQTIDSLIYTLGADTDVGTITTEHADEWRKAITTATAGEGRRKKSRSTADNRLAPATVAKRVHVAKQIFGKAVSWGWIATNPFQALRAGSQANPARAAYVDDRTMNAVLEALPGPQWRSLVGLCRYAGLRCPSEIGGLTWADVNLADGRLTVRSPKTEHHGGDHAVRFVPIRPILEEAQYAADTGEVLVVPIASRQGVNLRTEFERAIVRAGCRPWPRLFQNLRASCETDWVQSFPAHVVAKWLGHSPRIAQEHYLQVRDAHFAAAIGGPERGTKCGTIVAPNAAPHATEPTRKDRNAHHETAVIPGQLAFSPEMTATVNGGIVGNTGFERPHESPGFSWSASGAAPNAAPSDHAAVADALLAALPLLTADEWQMVADLIERCRRRGGLTATAPS
jgi:integrase